MGAGVSAGVGAETHREMRFVFVGEDATEQRKGGCGGYKHIWKLLSDPVRIVLDGREYGSGFTLFPSEQRMKRAVCVATYHFTKANGYTTPTVPSPM